MGDRTEVTLTILTKQVPSIQHLLDEHSGHCVGNGVSPAVSQFEFYEVNYGELNFLPDLVRLGIAYDSEWEAGGEYGAGGEYLRFAANGAICSMEFYESQRNPDLHELMLLIDKPELLRQAILDHAASLPPTHWDDQIARGKLYQTYQLITPAT